MLVALLALFVALGGVGAAATGSNFILGQSNTANKTTGLSVSTLPRAAFLRPQAGDCLTWLRHPVNRRSAQPRSSERARRQEDHQSGDNGGSRPIFRVKALGSSSAPLSS
jgi:hypothetical protein